MGYRLTVWLVSLGFPLSLWIVIVKVHVPNLMYFDIEYYHKCWCRFIYHFSGISKLVCSKCGQLFNSKSTLAYHDKKYHTGLRPYKCEYCEKAFIQKSQLDDHRRTHTGEKPFQCEICGKGFSQRSYVKDHVRTHTNERPHMCEICGKSFAIKTGLKAHKRRHLEKASKIKEVCRKYYQSPSLWSYFYKGKKGRQRKWNFSIYLVFCRWIMSWSDYYCNIPSIWEWSRNIK